MTSQFVFSGQQKDTCRGTNKVVDWNAKASVTCKHWMYCGKGKNIKYHSISGLYASTVSTISKLQPNAQQGCQVVSQYFQYFLFVIHWHHHQSQCLNRLWSNVIGFKGFLAFSHYWTWNGAVWLHIINTDLKRATFIRFVILNDYKKVTD